MYKEMGVKMLRVAKAMEDKSFFIRLNTIPNAHDAVDNDVMYRLACWVVSQRKTTACINEGIQNIEDISRVLGDIETINTVRLMLEENNDTVLTMNDMNLLYNNLIGNEGNQQNFKQYLKELLQENISKIVFNKPKSRKESERVCLSNTVSDAVHQKFKMLAVTFTRSLNAQMFEKILYKENHGYLKVTLKGLQYLEHYTSSSSGLFLVQIIS